MEEKAQTLEEFLTNLDANNPAANENEKAPGEGQELLVSQGQPQEMQQEGHQETQQATGQETQQEVKPETPSFQQLQQEIEALKKLSQQQAEYLGILATTLYQLQQPQPQPVHEVKPEPVFPPFEVPEDLPEELQKEIEELYVENPAKALAKVARYQLEQAEKKRMEYYLQQQQEVEKRRQQLQRELAEGYADLIKQYGGEEIERLGPVIEEVLTKQYPGLLMSNPREAIKVGFEIAKARQAMQQRQVQPNIETLLKDAQVKEAVKAALRDEIMREMAASAYAANSKSPQVIATQPGGMAPATPPESPKTLDESLKLFLSAYKH